MELVARAEDALGEGRLGRGDLGGGRVAGGVLLLDDVLEGQVELLNLALDDEGLVLVAGIGGLVLLLGEAAALLPELLGIERHAYSLR